MKIIPKYNIGDLVMCRVFIDPLGEQEEENLRSVIGWITGVQAYQQNNLIAYKVQWSDKEEEMMLSEEDMHRFVEYVEKARKG